MKNPFHLAIPVHDLIKANNFYQNILGCERGRSSESWIDFDLFGHQLVCHHSKNMHKETICSAIGKCNLLLRFHNYVRWQTRNLICIRFSESDRCLSDPKKVMLPSLELDVFVFTLSFRICFN